MNQNSKTDLMTLTHPLMLLSIFILLINDHVLKIHFPSALTGKLSDFAGLFFFPILLSAILHFVLKSFQFQSRNIALSSFGFTAIFFSLIKTIPFFNDFIEKLFSIQIILDPSDLMTLIMLPLAWRLRGKVKNKSKARISKLSYVVLGIGSLATIATSPTPGPASIYNLIVFENIIYADFSYDANIDIKHEGIAYSTDGGRSWKNLDFVLPEQVIQERVNYPKQPYTYCLPSNMNICYKTNKEQILESQNGGTTWEVSWEIPKEREVYFQRDWKSQSLDILDIVHVEINGEVFIIASAGSQGVLIKTANLEWESIGVMGAGPIQLKARSFEEAREATQREFNIITILGLILIYINVLVNIENKKSKGHRLFIISTWACFAIPFVGLLLFEIPRWRLPNQIDTLLNVMLLLFSLISMLLVVILTIHQFLTNTSRHTKENFVYLIATTLLSYLLFIFWAFGIISKYATSQTISVVLCLYIVLRILGIDKSIQAKLSRSKRDLQE